MAESDTRRAAQFRQQAGEAAVAGRTAACLVAAQCALLLAPMDTASCYYLSLASRGTESFSDSRRFAKWALAAFPKRNAVPLHRELFTLAGLAKYELSTLRRAVLIAPGNADGLYNVGNAEDRAGRSEAALLSFARADIIRPLHSGTLGNIARIKSLIIGHERAGVALRKALCVEPSDVRSLRHGGLWRRGKDDPLGAVDWFRRAVIIDPGKEVQGELGRALMMTGELEEGWRRLEYFRLPDWHAPVGGLPRWEGQRLFEGSLLLWSMDKIGDELFFSTFLQRALKAAGRVTLLVDPRNCSLLRVLHPEIRIISSIDEAMSGNPQWKASACYPLDFVGRFFAKTLEDLGEKGEERVLGKSASRHDLLHIGISWKSDAELIGGLKSTDLADWKEIFAQPGCRFFSLQYGDVSDDLEAFPNIETIEGFDPFGATLNFAERVSELDLVITVGNTTAHVAARTETPVWVLLASGLGPSWIWLRQGTQTPVYPLTRIFRQPVPGDWKSAFRQVVAELSCWVRSR